MSKSICLTLILLLVSGFIHRKVFAQPAPGPAIVSPEVHSDNTVTFRFMAKDAKEVKISAQFIKEAQLMTKDDKGLWTITLGPAKPDIYPYCFLVDGIQVMDPNNPSWFPNEFFKNSLVDIPDDKPLIHSIQNVPHGTLTYTSYKSKSLNGTERPLVIYTPPGYDENSGKKYPVLYLISGTTDTEETWTKVGRANFIIDNLIAQGKVVPMIVVMPYGNTGMTISGPSAPDVVPMYKSFANDFMTDIVPFTEKNFRVIADREHRAIAGFSRGGGQTLWTGLSNTDKFAYICSFSAYLTTEAFEQNFSSVYSNHEKTNKQMKLFWLSVGNEDFLYKQAIEFMDLLKTKNIQTKTMITTGGHTWMNCKLFLSEAAPLLFR